MKTPLALQKARQRAIDELDASDDEPSRLDFIVQMISGTASTEVMGIDKAFTLRGPVHICSYLDAMAEVAGVSRNLLAFELLEYAIADVLSELPEDVGQTVQTAFTRFIAAELERSKEGA